MIGKIVKQILEEVLRSGAISGTAGAASKFNRGKKLSEAAPESVNKFKTGAAYNAMKILAQKEGEDDEESDEGTVEIPKEDFEQEHESLVGKLRRKDPEELDDEADTQEEELTQKKQGAGSKAISIVIRGLKGVGK